MSAKFKTFLQRLFSTVILLALLGGAVWWNNPIGYAVLICLFCNLTTWEWFNMLKGSGANRALVLIGGLVYPWLMTWKGTPLFVKDAADFLPWEFPVISVGLLVLYVLAAFICEIFRMDYGGRSGAEALKSVGLTLLGFIYPVWLFSFALNELSRFAIPLVLWIILFTKMSDIWAYCCGVLCGRKFISRPFSPTVSPKKSWEGIIGSYILTLTAGWFLAVAMGVFGKGELAVPLFPLCYLIGGSILFFLSVTGDLAGSLIKRGLAVKDSGSLLPGIGGIFDLIDSPAFTVSFCFAVIPLIGTLLD